MTTLEMTPPMTTPRAIVIRAAGTNCDLEMVRGFELAGASAELVHLDALLRQPDALAAYDIIGFPGGFSYGDDVASGRVYAMKCRAGLYPALRDAAQRGVPMIGVCNGFQVMAQLGLLPGPIDGVWPADQPPAQTMALTENASARFIDDWVGVEVDSNSRCIWTRDLVDQDVSATVRERTLVLPRASGEGRLVVNDEQTLQRLRDNGQIALRYSSDINGSTDLIAGVCDVSGRIFGLMPHPDRYLDWTLHPFWTSLQPDERTGEAPGLRLFRNAVNLVRAEQGSGAAAGAGTDHGRSSL